MQSIPKQSKPASRWFTPWAIGFALACSVSWVGSASAGEYSSDLNSVILRLQEIRDDVDDMLALYHQDYPDLYLYIESISDQTDALLRSLDSAKDSTTGGFNVVLAASQLATLTSSLQTLDRHMRALGVGTVTNFLGEVDFDDAVGDLWQAFADNFTDGSGCIYVMPYSEDYMDMGFYLEGHGQISGPHGSWFDGAPVGTLLQANSLFTYQILQLLQESGVGSSNAVIAAQSNLVISAQMATYASSNQTAIASVYEKLDALEGTPTDEEIQESTDADTYTNAVPTAPLQLGSVDVDTSSMESVLDPIGDGLQGLIPTESTTKPKIMMMQGRGNRAGGNVEVELNLDGLEAVTRILRVLYKVGLWVGVIGILRSEWAFWSTLGGSAT